MFHGISCEVPVEELYELGKEIGKGDRGKACKCARALSDFVFVYVCHLALACLSGEIELPLPSHTVLETAGLG